MPTGVYIRTEKTKEALRKSHVGMLGKKHSKETITKLSKSHKGLKYSNRKRPEAFTEEHRANLSASKRGNKNCIGREPWNKGMKEISYTNIRENRVKKNGGSHTEKEWEELKKRYGYKCSICGVKDNDTKLTKDHIRPVSRGGNSSIANIQPLCKSCNCKKHAKILLTTRPPVNHYQK